MRQFTHQRGHKNAVPAAVEEQIDENLKRLYQQQLEQDLPDTLKALVARLRDEGNPS